MALLAASQGLIWGTLTVYLVVLAVRVLDVGASGVGFLDAIMGVSTVVGGVVVLGRIGRGRLATDMSIGVLGWSLPLLLVAAYPSPVTVVIALMVIGLMDPWVNVGLETIPQRVAPERVISRVYAVVEAALIGAMALGAFVAPLVLSLLGLRGAFALFGALVTIYAVATFGAMRRLDGRLTEPEGLDLLRAISIFAPLDPATLETLAHRLELRAVATGQEILRMGEASDSFFVIRSGQVEVTQGGHRPAHGGRGRLLRRDRTPPRRSTHRVRHGGGRHRAAGPRSGGLPRGGHRRQRVAPSRRPGGLQPARRLTCRARHAPAYWSSDGRRREV